MKLGKLAEYYYSAAEARKRLGVDESTFQYWGKEERITRTYLPGRKQPVYSKKEIDSLASEIEATIIVQRAKGTEFRKATPQDLEDENQLAQLVFGRGADAMPRKMYLEANPNIDYHLYDQGKLVAYTTIFPLKKEAIRRFMIGEIRGWQISREDFEQFEPAKPIECLVMDMVTTPTVPPDKRSEYGRTMISHLLRELQAWGEQGVEITKFHAVSSTPAGQHILASAKFVSGTKITAGRVTFELDVSNSDAIWLRGYKAALEQWKLRQKVPATSSPSAGKTRGASINP